MNFNVRLLCCAICILHISCSAYITIKCNDGEPVRVHRKPIDYYTNPTKDLENSISLSMKLVEQIDPIVIGVNSKSKVIESYAKLSNFNTSVAAVLRDKALSETMRPCDERSVKGADSLRRLIVLEAARIETYREELEASLLRKDSALVRRILNEMVTSMPDFTLRYSRVREDKEIISSFKAPSTPKYQFNERIVRIHSRLYATFDQAARSVLHQSGIAITRGSTGGGASETVYDGITGTNKLSVEYSVTADPSISIKIIFLITGRAGCIDLVAMAEKQSSEVTFFQCEGTASTIDSIISKDVLSYSLEAIENMLKV